MATLLCPSASAAVLEAVGTLSVPGEAGTLPAPNMLALGFSVFGSTDAAMNISTAAGNTVFNGAVQVSSDVYVVGRSTFSGAAVFLSSITVGEIGGLGAPVAADAIATKAYVVSKIDNCALGSAAAADILSGKTADLNCDGVAESGTMPVQTLDPANDTVSTGYYAAGTLSAVDTDLAPANIKTGVVIFGKTGTYAGPGYALPDTGQSTSYTGTYGEDHDYQPAASQMNYTDNGDGTVTDNRTALMWAKDGSGPGCFNGNQTTWTGAITTCEELSFAGYDDWRLPNVRELSSILNLQNTFAIDETYFTNTIGGIYWTSTTYIQNPSYAWVVRFDYGGIAYFDKSNTPRVRCVRAGL